MTYCINIQMHGFNFRYGFLDYTQLEKGLLISYECGNNKLGISDNDENFYSSLHYLFDNAELLDALWTMNHFEYFVLQNNGWKSLKQYHGFKSLEKYKFQALLTIECSWANETQRSNAETVLAILNGDYVFAPDPEKSPEQKARIKFEHKKPNLRLKLTIRDGYKCIGCGLDRENSLCVMQIKPDDLNFDLDNLHLICRSCIRKKK